MVFGVHYVSALHICFLHTGLAAVFFGRLQYVTLVLIITAAGFYLPYPPLSLCGEWRNASLYSIWVGYGVSYVLVLAVNMVVLVVLFGTSVA